MRRVDRAAASARSRTMNRPLAPLVALGIVVMLATTLMVLAGHAPARAQPAMTQCHVVANKVAAPARVPLGQWAQVTLTVRATCPATMTVPVHVMLVLDNSGSMANGGLKALQNGVAGFIDDLQMDHHPNIEV